MRMEGEPPCGWTRGFHADGLWGRCSLSLFADPLDFTISNFFPDISAELTGFGGKWYNSP